MTLPAYPSDLPYPQLRPYTLQPVDNTIGTEMSKGLFVQRERAPNAPTKMTAVWRVRGDVAALLEGWLKHHLGYWTMNVQVPLGLLEHQVQVVGRLRSMNLIGKDSWEYSATVLVRQAETLSAEAVDVIAEFGIDDVRAASPLLHTLIHTDLPGSLVW